jgi:chromosome segregation ATPase
MSASERQRFVRRLATAVLAATALASASAWAQQPSREQEQIRRLRLQVQQLQQEQSTQTDAVQRANTEKAGLKGKLDAAEAELSRLRKAAANQARSAQETEQGLQALQDKQNALQASQEELKTALQASNGSLTKLRTDQAELQRTLAQRDAALADLGARHQTQAQGLQSCIANNQALAGLGRELLQRYADKGMAEVLAQNEPFLQVKRVAMENLLQGYEDKLDQQALKSAAKP